MYAGQSPGGVKFLKETGRCLESLGGKGLEAVQMGDNVCSVWILRRLLEKRRGN